MARQPAQNQADGTGIDRQFSFTRLSLLTGATTVVLVQFQPQWAALGADLHSPRSWVQRAGADHAAVTLASTLLWLAGCWLSVGLVCALVALVPGRAGRRSDALARLLMPRLLQRLVLGVAGVSLIFGPVGAFAATAPTPSPSSITLIVPTDDGSAGHYGTSSVPSAPPAAPSAPPAAPSAPPAAHPAPPAAHPAPPAAATAAPSAAQIIVQPGDSLWALTGRHLGARPSAEVIAAEWPRLYAANRTVIGADPALLQPGQILTYPAEPGPGPSDGRTSSGGTNR